MAAIAEVYACTHRWTHASPENHGVDIAGWPDFEDDEEDSPHAPRLMQGLGGPEEDRTGGRERGVGRLLLK